MATVGVNGLPTLTTGGKSGQPVTRRTGNVTLPHTVVAHMNQCPKGVNEILKNTVEQIAFAIPESGTSGGKVDAAQAQQEKELLILKHSKELTDLRHNHGMSLFIYFIYSGYYF